MVPFIITKVTQLVGIRTEPSNEILHLLCAFYISQNQLYKGITTPHFKDEAAEVRSQNQRSGETSSGEPLSLFLSLSRST